MRIGKKDIVAALIKGGMMPAEATEAHDRMIEVLKGFIETAESVRLHGLGKFKVSKSPARKGWNPKTGTTMAIPERARVNFKTAGPFKARLNGDR